MAEKRGQYVYNDDGTISQLVSISGADSSGSGLAVTTGDILPVDIQSRYATTIQTHNAVSVGATTGVSASAYFNSDGFDKLGFTFKNDASTACSVDIYWSNDGTADHGLETILTSGSRSLGSAVVDVKASWFKITLRNTDASAHTMSAWAYLKA